MPRPTAIRRFLPILITAAAASAALVSVRGAAAESPQAAFAAENDAAMDKMMAAMHVEPSGDIDRDFATMMIPHHQGAIDMAVAELRYGRNEQLRRIAQEIIVEQQQEIDAMRLAVGLPASTQAPAPTQGGICTTRNQAQATPLDPHTHTHTHTARSQ
ncbi:MAG: DUF305 domain-containing protein [Proteobacteria bacterium]|nr:DUF305 domain-containing protein [Pseudomonadota bacterium]